MLAVCATPIGNLDDVTLRVLAELREADLVLAEDTRHTRGLLQRHGIEAKLLSYHEHNEASRVAELLPRIVAGERIALVSDAGLPGVSDPGARLVRAALDAGVAVTVLPGASAVETALVASGLVSERYAFVGFLPRRAAGLAALWEELAGWRWPVVAFESPQRLGASLRSLAAVTPERDVVVCRELTKKFEEVVRGTASSLADRDCARAGTGVGAARGGRGCCGCGRAGRGRNPAQGGRRGRVAFDRHVSQRPLSRFFVTEPYVVPDEVHCDNFVTFFDNPALRSYGGRTNVLQPDNEVRSCTDSYPQECNPANGQSPSASCAASQAPPWLPQAAAR
jgi:16S rRNA (cytidine1402-2'-O)-methyltransferase